MSGVFAAGAMHLLAHPHQRAHLRCETQPGASAQPLLQPQSQPHGGSLRANGHCRRPIKAFATPAPESLTPKLDWFSNFQKDIGEKNETIKNGKYNGSDKLVPHPNKHEKYS
ncbi:MAG: hypothetical protein ACKO2L_22375, partial [Planctomycetaceae bacterium]